MDSGSEVTPANSNVNLDELDPIIKEIVKSINPESPEPLISQAALILDYCGKKGDDLKTNLKACDAGTTIFHAVCALLTIINNIYAPQKLRSYNAADMALFV